MSIEKPYPKGDPGVSDQSPPDVERMNSQRRHSNLEKPDIRPEESSREDISNHAMDSQSESELKRKEQTEYFVRSYPDIREPLERALDPELPYEDFL